MTQPTEASRQAARGFATNHLNGPDWLTELLAIAFDVFAQAREDEIIAWLRTTPSVIGLNGMAAWNTSCHIERHDHRKDRPDAE